MRWAAAAGCWCALSVAAVTAGAQVAPSVRVTGPSGNPITDGFATFAITTSDFAAADLPLLLQLQVSTTPDFSAPLFADTTVAGSDATITIPKLLPGSGNLYWRVFALTARAGSVPSPVTGPRAAPTHLRLIAPNNSAGQSLRERRPTFTWQASRVPTSIGRWEFELRIDETATGRARFITNTLDTTLTIGEDLEANASYRWSVKARLTETGDSLTVPSVGSFVILSDESPFTTLLHHPFPSPFPFGAITSTCIWFDLSVASTVTIDVIDMRGLLVKRIASAGTGGSAPLAPGRYGRPSPGATSGCDDTYAWDGTDARGRVVPPGAYLIRMRAGGHDFKDRVVFQGR